MEKKILALIKQSEARLRDLTNDYTRQTHPYFEGEAKGKKDECRYFIGELKKLLQEKPDWAYQTHDGIHDHRGDLINK